MVDCPGSNPALGLPSCEISTSYFASLCLSALICKVGKVKQAPEYRIVVKMKGVRHEKSLEYVQPRTGFAASAVCVVPVAVVIR